jgi:hypothetical protein
MRRKKKERIIMKVKEAQDSKEAERGKKNKGV